MTTSEAPHDRVLRQVDVVLAEHEQQVAVVREILPPEVLSNGAEYWAQKSRGN